MAAYLARRFLQAALILFGITLVTFFLLFILPADPARQIAGRGASTPALIESIRQQLGLDLPFHEQYWRYLVRLAHGDLGRSYLQKSEVSALILSRLPATLLLMVGAIATELALGLSMGAAAALKRGRAADQALMLLSFTAVSAPQSTSTYARRSSAQSACRVSATLTSRPTGSRAPSESVCSNSSKEAKPAAHSARCRRHSSMFADRACIEENRSSVSNSRRSANLA